MVPAVFVTLDALPLTAHGKVDRKALPAPEAARSEPEGFVAPRSAAEETLAGVWREVLGLEQIGVRDDFFLLGGHSLSAARILSRVRDALGVDLSLVVIFETPTIEGMAAAVADATPVAPAASAPVMVPDEPLLANVAALSDGDLDALLLQMIGESK